MAAPRAVRFSCGLTSPMIRTAGRIGDRADQVEAGRVFVVIGGTSDGFYTADDDFVIEIVAPVVPIVPTSDFFV